MNKDDFTIEELEALNNELKKAEQLELPQELSGESIAQALSELPKPEKKAQKSSKGSAYKRALACVAAFAVIASALFITKPWDRSPVITPAPADDNLSGKKSEATVQVTNSPATYEELETIFLTYQRANRQSQIKRYFNSFSSKGADSQGAVDLASPEGAMANGGELVTYAATAGTLGDDASYITGDENNTEHGETNEQVKGVNEADIVKNDGTYLYMAVNTQNYYYVGSSREADDFNCGIAVIKPAADGSMTVESVIYADPQGDELEYAVQNMYVKGDRLVVIYNVYSYHEDLHYSDMRTAVICFDITNRAAPVEERRFYQSGYHISTRLAGNNLILLTNHSVELFDDKQTLRESCIPQCGSAAYNCRRLPAENICVMDNLSSPSYLVVTNMDITRADLEPASAAILGGGSNVYCTTDTLYVTNAEYNNDFVTAIEGVKLAVADIAFVNSGSSTTTLYSFNIADGNVIYNAKTSLDGMVLNQFSIDEYNGNLRIATTTGFGTDANNYLYVLDLALNTVGKLSDIAPGESIKSVRFMGEKGYVVTFLQTDPLFVIDLSSPASPTILGELKITGFSAYLHPVTDNLLIGIGYDGTDDGANDKLKVSLFDVSDPENPTEADKLVYGTDDMYVWSDAYYDHKAICYNDNTDTLYFPLYAERYYTVSSESLSYPAVIGLDIDTQGKKLGQVTEYKGTNEYHDSFSRCTSIDDVIFGLSVNNTGTIMSFNKATGERLSTLSLNGYSFPEEYTPKGYTPDTPPETTAQVTAEEHESDNQSDTAAPAEPGEIMTTPAFNPDDTTAAPEDTASAAIEDTTAASSEATTVTAIIPESSVITVVTTPAVDDFA